MPTFLLLDNRQPEPLPAEFAGDDVRYTEELVAHFLGAYTRPDDVVLDPFAGYGTTLVVAERMGRRGYGVELDPARAAYARSRLRHPARLVTGDARRLETLGLPSAALAMTSPPYMRRDDPEDPCAAYRAPGRGYAAYLRDLAAIFAQVGALLTPGAHAVVEVANLKGPAGVTPLAWDVAAAIGTVLPFEGEIVVGWRPHYGYGYDHSYCLVFGPPATPEREGSGVGVGVRRDVMRLTRRPNPNPRPNP